MFSIKKIQNSLLGLVGIRQPHNLEYAVFDSSNTLSESGLFLNDVGIFKPEFFIDNSDTLIPIELNSELENIKKASAVNICTKVFGQKQPIDFQQFFTNSTKKINAKTLNSGLYGYLLTPLKKQNTALKINSVALEFDGLGELTINLIHADSNQILETKIINIASKYQVEDLNWYLDSEIHYKGDYILGYIYNSDLKPFYRDNLCINNVQDVCTSSVFELNRTDFTDIEVDNLTNNSDYNGMNFSVSVYEDYTRFILQNKTLFAKALQIEIVCQIFNKVISSTRSNIKERYSKDLINLILIEIRGYESKKGLEAILLDEIAMLQQQIKELKPFESKIYIETLC